LSKERTEWRRIAEKAKTTVGCNGNKIIIRRDIYIYRLILLNLLAILHPV
jgi:hypothetical protein